MRSNELPLDPSVTDLGTHTVTATIPIGSARRKIVVQQATNSPIATAMNH